MNQSWEREARFFLRHPESPSAEEWEYLSLYVVTMVSKPNQSDGEGRGKIKGNAWSLVLMLNQPFLPSLSTSRSALLTMCREKREERFPDIHSSDRLGGNLKERDQAGCSVEAERLRERNEGEEGVCGCVWVSVSEEDLSTCPSPHSSTFQGSHRQSVVRGPGTDLGSACQQQISLIEIAKDPYSHAHGTESHGKNAIMA
ncbi:IAA-amino acid hydrolase ILR1-like 4 [Dissostichus eleginoides]|uniref:IAA-amino acid hydrolase ILR1-like 4 n=1 Tax=Dissostichus eleginoides TaxID=100907 RepID=A0AAD9CFX7_DISEL|nr:IAA-amino acid hydrolase ILR1-like 4 [Dissostichus eleginoides]